MKASHKLGLYARYERVSMTLIDTIVKPRQDADKSNANSRSYYLSLISENPQKIHSAELFNIPKTCDEIKPTNGGIECEWCLEFFAEEYIYNLEDINNISIVLMCNGCAEERHGKSAITPS